MSDPGPTLHPDVPASVIGSRWDTAGKMAIAEFVKQGGVVITHQDDGSLLLPGYVPTQVVIAGELLTHLVNAHNELTELKTKAKPLSERLGL